MNGQKTFCITEQYRTDYLYSFIGISCILAKILEKASQISSQLNRCQSSKPLINDKLRITLVCIRSQNNSRLTQFSLSTEQPTADNGISMQYVIDIKELTSVTAVPDRDVESVHRRNSH